MPSPKVGAEHARYLGTGCSDRWFPSSRDSVERAPSSADERFDVLHKAAEVECDFRSQYPEGAGPKSRRFLATRGFFQSARQDSETPRIPEKEIGGYGGDVEDEM